MRAEAAAPKGTSGMGGCSHIPFQSPAGCYAGGQRRPRPAPGKPPRPLPLPHLTATMCLATASWPRRPVSQARTVRAFSIVSAVVNVLLQASGQSGSGQAQ